MRKKDVQKRTYRPGTYKPGTYRPGTYKPGTYRPGICEPGTCRPGIYRLGLIVCLAALFTISGSIAGTGVRAVWAAENDALAVTGLTWDESDGTARWDGNANARYYQVRLFRNGDSVTSVRTTKDLYYEFEENITRKGDYHFEVRAAGQGSEKGPWASSYEWYVTSSEAEDLGGSYSGSGSGAQDVYHGPGVPGGGYYGGYDIYGNYYGTYNGNYNGNYGGSSVAGPDIGSGGPGVAGGGSGSGSRAAGFGGFSGGPGIASAGGNHWCVDTYGWWYQYANGTWPRACWQCIDGSWYCFDDNGYRRYGWIQWNGSWYYCGEDGALMANTRTPDGYYVGSDGVWVP